MSQNLKKGVLLIADDEIDFRDILVELLSPLADQIHVAGNGQEALQFIKSGVVDAVLTDIKMPIMNGLQLIAEVRSLFLQTPMIVLTGQGDFSTIQEALRLDATDFVEKPFDRQSLKDAVTKALEFGVALREMDAEIELLYAESSLPPDKVLKLKKIKKATLGMKLGFSSYVKKKA